MPERGQVGEGGTRTGARESGKQVEMSHELSFVLVELHNHFLQRHWLRRRLPHDSALMKTAVVLLGQIVASRIWLLLVGRRKS